MIINGCIGQSDAFLGVQKHVALYAPHALPVLVTGESGTGKEKTARALHDQSTRRDQSFIAINCAALPRDLMESELFGHVKGAFTGADRNHAGLIDATDGGTLFLDEIGDMDMALQAKLLRFCDSGEFRPVGSIAPKTADVRIIAATNRNLQQAVENGLFRADLYYRLAVLTIALPPLRARRDDIPLLADYFLKGFAEETGGAVKRLTPAAIKTLQQHDWPGNIRELNSVLMRACVTCPDDVIDTGDVMIDAPIMPDIPVPNIPASNVTPIKSLRDAENDAITAALRQCGGNVLRAAALLQVAPSTLYRRMETTSSKDTCRTY